MKKIIYIILCFLMFSCSTTKNTNINDVEFCIVDEINSDLIEAFGEDIYLLKKEHDIIIKSDSTIVFLKK